MANKLKLKYVFDDKCQKDENIKILRQKMSRMMFQGDNCLFEKNSKFSTSKSSTLYMTHNQLDITFDRQNHGFSKYSIFNTLN